MNDHFEEHFHERVPGPGRGARMGGPPFRNMWWGSGPGGPGGRRGRMRRGDIRTAVLAILAEEPAHGYEIIQRLEAKSEGAWRPSPGSVYPMLQLLEDEGLVRSFERDGKRVFEITDAGREEATRRVEEAGGAPWDLAQRGGKKHAELRDAMMTLALAVKQVAMAGKPGQIERATEIIASARKQLYALLAED